MNSISISRIILFTTYAGAKFSQVFIYAWASSLLTAEVQKTFNCNINVIFCGCYFFFFFK